MKHFLIKYRFTVGSEQQWHQDVARFIAALNDDPELAGKISYRCLKHRAGADCYHLATVTDDGVNKVLQSREFFQRYTAQAKLAADGTLEVLPLDVIAETTHIA